MPPARSQGRRRRTMAVIVAVAAPPAVLTACVQEGDFGRRAPSAWNGLVDSTGSLAAEMRGEAAPFPYTDDERTLRDRAWRYLMPAAGRDAFTDVLANLTRSRVLPPNWRADDDTAYHETLVAESFRSPVSRYRRLGEDASADARLMPAFAATAARVRDADSLRLRGLPSLRTLNDTVVRDAALRVAENRCLVAWVRLETAARVARYRYALSHLLVEIPDAAEAVSAERSIVFLDGRRSLLDPLLARDAEARCGLLTPEGAPMAGPLVRKG
ncbi:hypothetical protein ASG40_02195 [Methylobacterium sp. Leaf399]|nr:hypothetical protein ASG40_02195 [Methylobacterium sp. Leaf399]